ncbi:MAG: phage head morphogenesis protein [Bacteroidales bacterium]|nr:phage head morphogenesis protein [Bacteroidales bacterium]
MPVRPPHDNETREQYVFDYCVPLEEEAGYPHDQAIAMCNRYYDENKSQKAYQPRQWSTIDRKRAKYRAKHRPLMGKALDQSIQPILDIIDRTTDIQNLPGQNLFIDDEPIKKAYKDLYVDTGSFFAMFDRRQAQKNAGLYLVKDEEEVYESVIAEEMAAYARKYVGQNIKIVGDTSKVIIQNLLRDIVPEILEQGLGAGEAQTMLRDRIESEWHRFKRFRTERIVRTETTAASNVGSLKGVRSTGIPHEKIWTAAFDERTREAHANANMQRVDTDKAFTVGGENLDHPGDPSGSAGNIINCRCALTYEMKR